MRIQMWMLEANVGFQNMWMRWMSGMVRYMRVMLCLKVMLCMKVRLMVFLSR